MNRRYRSQPWMKGLTVAAVVVAFLAMIAGPWWLVRLPWFGAMLPNEIGDFLGGIANFFSSIVTVILLYIVWTSERNDDRKASFMSSLMSLIQMHIEERHRVLQCKPDGSYFRWFWQHNIGSVLQAPDNAARMRQANKLYDERYDEISGWVLSVLRVVRFIEDATMTDKEKHESMRLFRLFCEREEQRALFLILFSKDELAETPILLMKHDFFKYAGFKESEELLRLRKVAPKGWWIKSPKRQHPVTAKEQQG